jgi:hypothetical protein
MRGLNKFNSSLSHHIAPPNLRRYIAPPNLISVSGLWQSDFAFLSMNFRKIYSFVTFP